MKKIVRLTESDLARIVKRVIKEQGALSALGSALKGGQDKVKEQELQKWIDKYNKAYVGGGFPPLELLYKVDSANKADKNYLRFDDVGPYYPSDIKSNSCYANPKLEKGWYQGKETDYLMYVDVKFTDECIESYKKVARSEAKLMDDYWDEKDIDKLWPAEYTPKNVEKVKKKVELARLQKELGDN